MKKIRIAACQLETHPALYGDIAYLEEPFVPRPGEPSLSLLGTKGVEVTSLQEHCLEQYSAWNQSRVQGVLKHLSSFEPTPDIVLFPEGSIPVECLPDVAQWSRENSATVLAGTHTPQTTPSARRYYSEIELGKSQRKKLRRTKNVLPLIRSGRTAPLPKQVLSPFERSIVSSGSEEMPKYTAHPIQTQVGRIHLLALICAEALRVHNVARSYELVAIVAFDAKPDQFKTYVETVVRNRRAVAFCNDGAHGGTAIHGIEDSRTPNWLTTALPDGLPRGDAILLTDLDLDIQTVEVGTSEPRAAVQLVSLASLTYGTDDSDVRDLSPISVLPEAVTRVQRLQALIDEGKLDPLQLAKAQKLLGLDSRGVDSSDWWAALGRDCVVSLPSLRELEAELAALCQDNLTGFLTSSAVHRTDSATAILKFVALCGERAGTARRDRALEKRQNEHPVLDRDLEVRSIHDFLDQSEISAMQITGLPQIGKSLAVGKALRESGLTSIHRIRATETSTAEFFVFSLLKRGAGQPAPPYDDPVAVVRGDTFRDVVRSLRVIVIEKAHNLLGGRFWRDGETPELLTALVEVAEECQTRVVFETQRELPFDAFNSIRAKRLRIQGFVGAGESYGLSIFDAQLRRVGLLPTAVASDQKHTIVTKLGGHPVALAIAADAAYEEGAESVITSLKQRKGFYLSFVGALVRKLGLSDDERTLLTLLTLARLPVARTVLLNSVQFAAGPVLRNLIDLAAVDVTPDGLIEVPGILRGYFDSSELEPELVAAFHTAAARGFERLANQDDTALEAAVEAEFHAGLVGITVSVASRLIDGSLATAKSLYETQEYDRALNIVNELMARRRTTEVVRLAALVNARLKDRDAALKLAKEVFTANPSDTRLLVDLDKISLSQFDDRLAERLVEIARSAGVENTSVLLVKGRLHLRRREFNDAEASFERARELTEKNPWPYFYLGRVLMRRGGLDDAVQVLEEGIDFFYNVGSRNRRALNALRGQLGQAHLYAGRYDLAESHINFLSEDDPMRPETVQLRAALAVKTDGVDKARKEFQRLSATRIRNNFERCQFHLLYGLFYAAIDNRSEAARQFETAHRADRANVFVMMKWARTLYDSAVDTYLEGDDTHQTYVKQCAQLVEQILNFDPNNGEGISLMEDLHRKFGTDVGSL